MSIRVPLTNNFVQGAVQTVAVTASTYYLLQFFSAKSNQPVSVSFELTTDGGANPTYKSYADSVKFYITPGTTSLAVKVNTLDSTTFTNANAGASASVVSASSTDVYGILTVTN